MWNNAGRDCDYGNYRDMNNDECWSDNFYPDSDRCEKAADEYNWRVREIVEELAGWFGLDTEGWCREDYEIFLERIGI